MVKLRICSEDPEEVEQVIDRPAARLFEQLFPDMRFSAVRLGGNPKYADDPKYFSYGEPRIRNKKPIDIDFSSVSKRLTLPKPGTRGKR